MDKQNTPQLTKLVGVRQGQFMIVRSVEKDIEGTAHRYDIYAYVNSDETLTGALSTAEELRAMQGKLFQEAMDAVEDKELLQQSMGENNE